MKQQQFATRLKSEALIKEIIEIWQSGDQKENMEGIENDPIFAMLITALAYRTNEIESEINIMKEGVINELSRRMIPHRQCRAIPSATIITTSLIGTLGERTIGSEASFTLMGSMHRYVPLCNTLIINGAVDSVERIDGRRWKVRIATKEPLSTLRGLSFHLETKHLSNLSISLDNTELNIIKPWDYANLPLANIFSAESQLYNDEELIMMTNRWIDLFAQLDSKLFYVGYSNEKSLHLSEREYLEFVFEFEGIASDFELTQQQIKINAIPIVNIEESWADISPNNPIVRLNSKIDNNTKRDFIGILPPSNGSNDYLKRILVREVGTERFSSTSLFHLIRAITERFSSDYYAFQRSAGLRDGNKIQQLYNNLMAISNDLTNIDAGDDIGCYITLIRDAESSNDNFRVRYLTTNAEQPNTALLASNKFTPSKTLAMSIATAISKPLLGVAPINDEMTKRQVGQYNAITQDRVVTPADIKALCVKELNVRYGINNQLIHSIMVAPRLEVNNYGAQYIMDVKIHIEQTLYVKRALSDISYIEHLLAKLISVRSVGVHSFDIKIITE